MKLFSKKLDFEQIWVNDKSRHIEPRDVIKNDDDYIDYKIWEDANCKIMFAKHFPNTNYYRGENPNIIFHGGCLGCLSQRIHGIDRCKKCLFFKFSTDKGGENLFIEGEESAKMTNEELNNILEEEL